MLEHEGGMAVANVLHPQGPRPVGLLDQMLDENLDADRVSDGADQRDLLGIAKVVGRGDHPDVRDTRRCGERERGEAETEEKRRPGAHGWPILRRFRRLASR
jgi:hypothetical protein